MKFVKHDLSGYGSETYWVEVGGARIGYVRKRREWYGNIGRGVTYTYWDAFVVLDGSGREKVYNGASTRREAAVRLRRHVEGRETSGD